MNEDPNKNPGDGAGREPSTPQPSVNPNATFEAGQMAAPTTQPMTSAHKTNGMAIAALIVGIVAFLSGWVPFWGFVAGATAVILGALSMKHKESKGLSITGLILGGLATLTSIVCTVLFFLGVLAIGGLGLAMSDYADDIPNNLESTYSDYYAQQEQFINAKKDFAKGETATFAGFEVKVNSVDFNYSPVDGSTPYSDEKFVKVNLTVKNITGDSQYFSGITFDLTDGDERFYSSFVDYDLTIDGGTIAAGKSITGDIIYDVPENATNLKLMYATSVYNTEDDSYTDLEYFLAI